MINTNSNIGRKHINQLILISPISFNTIRTALNTPQKIHILHHSYKNNKVYRENDRHNTDEFIIKNLL